MRAGAWVLLGGLLFSGCQPPRYDVAVGWSFADGRACAEAGVELVRLLVPGDQREVPVVQRCTAGQGGRRATVSALPLGGPVRAEAVSPAGGVLYRGEGSVAEEEPPGPLDLVLYYTGGL